MKILKKHGFWIGVLIFVFLCTLSLYLGCVRTNQSTNSLRIKVIFEGEYTIEGEESKPIDYENLPVTNKNVTLKGSFILVYQGDELSKVNLKNGNTIFLYFNHIGAQIYIKDQQTHIFDAENKMYGEDSCGKIWIPYTYTGEEGEIITIELINPHSFGNSLAVRDFLDSMYAYTGASLENILLKEGSLSRTIGIIILVISLVFIGVAIFSFAIRFSQSSLILTMGLLLFFGSGYFIYRFI